MVVKQKISRNRFAYTFYATDDAYAIAVLVVVKQLQKLGTRDDVEFVLLHLSISNYILSKMHEMGITTQKVNPLRYTYGTYYRDCLIKLKIFQLTQYDRVIFLDADSIPLKNIDELFTLPFTEDIAAPQAHFLQTPLVTSLLLVVKPSIKLWNRVEKHFESAFEKKYYDMDIINLEFKDEIYLIPDEYACLNSEWADRDTKFYFGEPEKSYEKIKIVHFSDLGKPWFYHPKKVRRFRPNAHPIYYDLWEKWWAIRSEILKESIKMKGIRFFYSLRFELKNMKKKIGSPNMNQ
jgi:alpha-N-acetylglucosamine transferase